MEQTPKDHAERRGYRKSPGRQYGYDYDPLHSRSGSTREGEVPTRSGRLTSGNGTNYRSEALTQRPDPRRTRQLLRQNILASKGRLPEDPQEQEYEEHYYDEAEEAPRYSQHQPSRSGQISYSHVPLTRRLEENYEDEEDLYEDADLGYEEELDDSLEVAENDGRPRFTTRLDEEPFDRSRLPARASRGVQQPEYDDYDEFTEYDDDLYQEEEEPEKRKRKRKKGGLTRRKVLFGLGAAAVGGGALAAVELGPKIPQTLGNLSTDVEKQVQDAFNKGLAQGADAARKELITSLESLEGVTLEGAIGAAKLTRVAYDVFVSPVVKLTSQITGDVLNTMLNAFKVGRDWLGRINQDNATLAAIQNVLESWVKQVQQLPKQLDTITQADLDGAQAYLRSLQRKIDEEKAKLNNPQGSSTPTPAPQPTKASQ